MFLWGILCTEGISYPFAIALCEDKGLAAGGKLGNIVLNISNIPLTVFTLRKCTLWDGNFSFRVVTTSQLGKSKRVCSDLTSLMNSSISASELGSKLNLFHCLYQSSEALAYMQNQSSGTSILSYHTWALPSRQFLNSSVCSSSGMPLASI